MTMANDNFPILYEDERLLAIDKPAHLLVQPLPNQNQPAVIDKLKKVGKIDPGQPWPDPLRPGLIHRLDRDTSGVLLIAKDPQTLAELQEQFAQRQIGKTYLALVCGQPTWSEYTLTAPVSRSVGTRRKAAFFQPPANNAKPAETAFRVTELFSQPAPGVGFLEAEPKTGRTNQIRVHLQLLGYPILGDPWYQTKLSRQLATSIGVERLMLHAQKLTFQHPMTGLATTIVAPLPPDMLNVIAGLRTND